MWDQELPFQVPFTNVARHILALVQSKETRTIPRDNLEDELFLSPCAAERGLNQLQKAGAVAVLDSGELKAAVSFDTSAIHLVAVEMKMRRWREALSQANAYLDFVDESYVVLDGNQVLLMDELVREFELSPVGLLVQRGTTVEKLVEAVPIEQRPSADRLHAVQKLAVAGPYCLAYSSQVSKTSNQTR